MKKRFLSVVLACSLTAVSLAGCGGGGSKETQPAAAPTTGREDYPGGRGNVHGGAG